SLSYRVAIPLNCFNLQNAFSTKCLILYKYQSIWSLFDCVFDFLGILALVFFADICSLNDSESYPLSAQHTSVSLKSSFSIIFGAILTSCVVPSEIIISIGLPSASTANCILELFPPMLLEIS